MCSLAATYAAAPLDRFLIRNALAMCSNAQVKNLLLTSTNTSLLTGAQFCGKDKSLIAVAAYDSRFIAIVPVPKLA
mgnify:CR=1 FL=1